MPNVMANSSLLTISTVRSPMIAMTETHQVNAPNTVAAFAAEHTCPKHTRSLKNTASAMNPANQKSMHRNSTPRMANLWCSLVSLNRQGTSMR